MSLVFLILAITAIWINLVGAGLAARKVLGDYGISRMAGVFVFCLCSFSVEHFFGWGPRPLILPVTTIISAALIWRYRKVVQEHWAVEALFMIGFLYCLAWRYRYPNITMAGEKMPNLAMLEAYMRGTRLPAPDIWMPPYRLNFYYSFQHYCASLMGRILFLSPGATYHLGYCVLVGLAVMVSGSCIMRLCPWLPGRWLAVLALLVGGSGTALAAHILIKDVNIFDSVRFVGASIYHKPTPWGEKVEGWMTTKDVKPRDLPMEPEAYVIMNGDFHPPLIGYVVLGFAALLIAAQELGATGRVRDLNTALLAATIPVALISNAWVFPLQAILVVGWVAYRAIVGDRGCLMPAVVGITVAALLEYPYLVEFTQQAVSKNASIGLTASTDRTPWVGWLLTFWPVVGIILLAPLNREHRSFALFLIVIWALELAFTELLYNHDLYGAVWARFNTSMKWWPWVYAGIIMSLGALNLGSKSRICRYGTIVLLAPTLIFAKDLGFEFTHTDKSASGNLSGYGWVKDTQLNDMIFQLGALPDGIATQSGPVMSNTEQPQVALFSGKMSYIGWPWHETTWRGSNPEIRQRMLDNAALYAGKLDDPLGWLLHHQVRYVIWVLKDNMGGPANFKTLDDKIKARYFWHPVGGMNPKFPVGFWELTDDRG